MLTKLIVASYAWILEIALWLTLAVASLVGYHFTVPILNNAGAQLANEFVWKLCGAFLFPVITFIALAVITGPFLVIVDIRQALRRIEARLERVMDVKSIPGLERREPTL